MPKIQVLLANPCKIFFYLLVYTTLFHGSYGFAQNANTSLSMLAFDVLIELARKDLVVHNDSDITFNSGESYLSNCTVSGTTLYGEALYVKGGTGQTSPEVNPPATPQDVAQHIQPPSYPGTVALILIADLGDKNNQQTHGSLVYKHMQALISGMSTDIPQLALGYVDVSGSTSDAAYAIRQEVGEASDYPNVVVNMSFSLIPCEFAKYANSQDWTFENYTDAISNNDTNRHALDAFRKILLDAREEDNEGLLRSFGEFVGIVFEKRRENAQVQMPQADNVRDAINNLLGLFGEGERPSNDFISLLVRYPHFPQNDPLLQTIRELMNLQSEGQPANPTGVVLARQVQQSRVVFVAAAGNQGFSFPLYPAAWSEVLAVSSSQLVGDVPQISRSSNYGQIMAPGSSFKTEGSPSDCKNNDFENPGRRDCIAYEGTSFAAPAVSLFIALRINEQNFIDQLAGLSYCNVSLFSQQGLHQCYRPR